MYSEARIVNRPSSGRNASTSLFCSASKNARFQSLYWTFRNTSASVRNTTVPRSRRARQRSSELQYGAASPQARRANLHPELTRPNIAAERYSQSRLDCRLLYAPLLALERVLDVALLLARDPIRPGLEERTHEA